MLQNALDEAEGWELLCAVLIGIIFLGFGIHAAMPAIIAIRQGKGLSGDFHTEDRLGHVIAIPIRHSVIEGLIVFIPSVLLLLVLASYQLGFLDQLTTTRDTKQE